jgi:DNA-binding transcriptional LysR family regulator
MTLRQLEYLVAVVDEGSFGRAALRLFVSQPTLSQQVRALESEIGGPLVERLPRGVRTTPAGEALLPAARDALSAVARLGDEARRVREAERAVLRVGFVGSAANELTPRYLRAFTDAHPGTQLDLVPADFARPDCGLADGAVDVAFVRLPVATAGRLRLRRLLDEPLVLVVAESHALVRTGVREVAGEDLTAEVFVPAPDDDPVFRDWWLDPAGTGRRARLAPPARSLDAWLERIAAGGGISFAPASTARYYGRPGVRFVPVRSAVRSRVAVACRRGDSRPLVSAFLRIADVMPTT